MINEFSSFMVLICVPQSVVAGLLISWLTVISLKNCCVTLVKKPSILPSFGAGMVLNEPSEFPPLRSLRERTCQQSLHRFRRICVWVPLFFSQVFFWFSRSFLKIF